MLFSKFKQKLTQLQEENAKLRSRLEELENETFKSIRILRNQVAGILAHMPPDVEAVLAGLGYTEIPSGQIPQFIQQAPKLTIIDVRTARSYNFSHIPQALNIPSQEIDNRLMEIPNKTDPVLIVCANGNTGLGVAQKLVQKGYRFVYNAQSGMVGYTGELDKSPPAAASQPLHLVTKKG